MSGTIEEARNKVREVEQTQFFIEGLKLFVRFKRTLEYIKDLSETVGSSPDFDGLELIVTNHTGDEVVKYISDEEAKQIRDYLCNLYGLPAVKIKMPN